MFRKLLLIVAFVAVGAGSYGIARALFTSKVPATSNASFTAGTIEINIEKHGGYNEVPFSMTNWMPGQKQMVVFDVRNSSTVPVTLSGEVNGAWVGNDSLGNPLGDQLVYVTAADYWNGSDWVPLSTTGHGTFTYNGPVQANGGIVTMRMEATFDASAGNEFQGKTYSADINVTATQVTS